jgi:hypothetical protein
VDELSDHPSLLTKIFHPFANLALEKMKDEGKRFVHYTSAAAALLILKNRAVWMRRADLMNDYKEVAHGFECLDFALKSPAGVLFREALNSVHEKIDIDVIDLFNKNMPLFERGTYITSISVHEDNEDDLGRLSMWRAYGGKCGVALVLNAAVFFTESDALKAYTSPVAYKNQNDVADDIALIAKNIVDNRKVLLRTSRRDVLNRVFNVFRFAVLCNKHPGFREENEWRIVHTPGIERSAHLKRIIQSVRDIPQPIYGIPLRDVPDEGLVGASIDKLIDRIIIGPTEFPEAVWEAFVSELTELNVTNATTKVVQSTIPLRQ